MKALIEYTDSIYLYKEDCTNNFKKLKYPSLFIDNNLTYNAFLPFFLMGSKVAHARVFDILRGKCR